jgi:predicted AlkP superfamily phosphohydrolase/phosphomutase
MKLLIIGIDGATFDLITPWAESGLLPNLSALLKEGSSSDLISTLPPVTSPAWPTFMTGCNPGKHGVFDFIYRVENDFELVNASAIRQPTIWQRLSTSGLKVGVLNVPVTYPPQPLNGYMITGLLSPKDANISYPTDLVSRYSSELGEYRVAPNIQYKPGNEAEYINDIYNLIHSHGDWALHLLKNEPCDVMMVHFIALDIMMHALWRFMDHDHPRFESTPYEHAIRDGYRLVDEKIGLLLNELSEDCTVLIMSDHGFGPLEKMVNLNIFLMEKGLLHLRDDTWTRLKSLAFKHGLTPKDAYRMVERIGLQNLATRVSKNTRNQLVGKFLSFDSVDWQRTIAYSLGHVGQIYLNVAGREPQGIIKESMYLEARHQVVEALRELVDEIGQPMVSRFVYREDIYSGPYAELGPDIHLELDHYKTIAFPLFATNGQIITSQIRGDSGCHRNEGIFIASGPAVQKGVRLKDANIADLAPTILQLLGQSVPRVMDGRVLGELFSSLSDVNYSEEEERTGPDSSDPALSEEESAQVEERLRSLGYL